MFELNVENKRPLVALAAVLVIALAAWAIYMNRQSSRTMSQPTVIKELDAALAQAVIQAVGDHGQIVLVTEAVDKGGGPGTGDRREPDKYAGQLQTQLDDFRQVLRSHPGVVIIAATERAAAELSSAAEAAKGTNADTSFYALAKKYPDADAIVSLIDPPNFDPEDLHRLPARLPKIITVASFRSLPDLRQLFAAGLLHTAILPRWMPVTDPAKQRQPAEWVSPNFQIVTNADMLPKPQGS